MQQLQLTIRSHCVGMDFHERFYTMKIVASSVSNRLHSPHALTNYEPHVPIETNSVSSFSRQSSFNIAINEVFTHGPSMDT